MSSPALIAWNRKAEWNASLTELFPLKENDRLLTPPDVLAPGQSDLILGMDSMKLIANLSCSSIPVATARIFASKIISIGFKPTSPTRIR